MPRAAQLVVTLDVADGVLAAEATPDVVVGGSPTALTFSGTAAALNAFFRSPDRIRYTTAPDNTAPRELRTTVSDGQASTTVVSRIRITPVNDAPTIAPVTPLSGALAGQPLVITHRMLVDAFGARDVEAAPLRFQVASVELGWLQKWDGARWVRVVPQPQVPSRGAVLPLTSVVRPGERIRWLPPAGIAGTVAAFTIRVVDDAIPSATTSQVSITVGP